MKQSSASESGVLLPLFAVVAVDAAGAGVLLPLLPLYARDFGASPAAIGALLACFSLFQFLSAPILGIASDRFGRKRLLVMSQIGTCASLLLLASADSLILLFVARILDGVTSGNISIAAAYASDKSDPGARRHALGIVSAGLGVGTMVGPAIGGSLAAFGSDVPFIAAAAISLASIVASIILLPGDASFARAGTSPKAAEMSRPTAFLPSLRAIAALPGLTGILVALSFFYLAFGLFTSQLALVLSERFEWQGNAFGPSEIGFVLTAASVVTISVQLTLMRRLGALVGDRPLAAASSLLLAIGFLTIGSSRSLPALAVAVVAIAVGSAIARPALISALSVAMPSDAQGAAMGVSQALGALFNIAAAVLGGLLIQANAFHLWGASMCLLAVGAAAVLIRQPKAGLQIDVEDVV